MQVLGWDLAFCLSCVDLSGLLRFVRVVWYGFVGVVDCVGCDSPEFWGCWFRPGVC